MALEKTCFSSAKIRSCSAKPRLAKQRTAPRILELNTRHAFHWKGQVLRSFLWTCQAASIDIKEALILFMCRCFCWKQAVQKHRKPAPHKRSQALLQSLGQTPATMIQTPLCKRHIPNAHSSGTLPRHQHPSSQAHTAAAPAPKHAAAATCNSTSAQAPTRTLQRHQRPSSHPRHVS